ncbi:hypothetical protein PMAYCL1PPCAC_05377, partial [Pristionchus mayeri]
RNYCTGKVEKAPADDGSGLPCEQHSPGNRTIFIDALMHDGSNAVFENYKDGHMAFDEGIGSWYFFSAKDLTGFKHYFLAAKCVRPPVSVLPVCECEPLPMDLPPLPGYKNPTPVTTGNGPKICPIGNVQFRLVRVIPGKSESQPDSWNRFAYCANKAWIQATDNAGVDNSYLISAASCIV